jgi:energy-coupling factor transporter ATP-binding protein EcfA2
MAYTAYPKTNPTILPPLPAVEGVSYFGRDLPEHHLDRQGHKTAEYIIPGVFPADADAHSAGQLVKAQIITFDLDFVDMAVALNKDETLAKARKHFADNGITQVWNKKKAVDVASDNDADHFVIIKAFLTSLPESSLRAKASQVAPKVAEFLKKYLGRLPRIINYSGTGIHLHYWLAADQGWTEQGMQFYPGDVTEEIENNAINLHIFKAAYDRILADFQTEFGYGLDEKCKDLGTRLTRDANAINYKCSVNRKTVTSICSEATEAEFLTAADITDLGQPQTRSKTAQAVVDAKGNVHDGRKARTPATVDPEATYTFLHNGSEVTLSAQELKDQWDDIEAAGCMTVDAHGTKLKGRMDWVSQGSLNAWVKMGKDGELIFRTQSRSALNANESHVFVEGGTITGIWVFANAVAHQLRRNSKGTLLPGLHNVRVILATSPETLKKIRKNSRLMVIEVHRDIAVAARPTDPVLAVDTREWHPLGEDELNYLLTVVERYYEGRTCQIDTLSRAISVVANDQSYDDVTSWVEGIQWDGVRRLDGAGAWLPRTLGLDPSHERFNLYSTYGRAAMLATARNIYHNRKDPVAAQHMLLIKGGQGAGKSTLAKTLAGTEHIGHEYFGDEEINIGGKSQDLIQLLVGKVMMEIPELAAFNKKDYAAIKSFLTRGRIEGRLAYARTNTKMWVSTYFVGTTNSLCPLGDPTGNRRFMVVDMHKDVETADGRLDLKYLRSVVPQLYAEAYQRVVLGANIPADRATNTVTYGNAVIEDWNLTLAEMKTQERHNLTFTAANQVLDAVNAYLDEQVAQGRYQLPMERFQKVLKEEYEITRIDNRTLSEALLDHGWVQRRSSVGGRRTRLWVYQGEQTGDVDSARLPGEKVTEAAPAPAPASDEPSLKDIMAQLTVMTQQIASLQADNDRLRKENEELRNGPKGPGPKGGKSAPKRTKKSQVSQSVAPVNLTPAESADEVLVMLDNESVQAFLTSTCTSTQVDTLNDFSAQYKAADGMARSMKGLPLMQLFNAIVAAH